MSKLLSLNKRFRGWIVVDRIWECWIEGKKRPNGFFSVVTKIGKFRRLVKELSQ